MPVIEILGLEKTYLVGFWRKRPKRALHPLHLTVEEGEVFGFLGPNGAGKTTTLKLLMGLVFPTSGSARLLGRDWTDPEVKAQIGFLPEQPYFYDYLTAHELLNYYGQLSGVPGKDRKRRIDEVLTLDPVEACTFRFPISEGAPLHLLHEHARVTAKRYSGEAVEVDAEVPESIRRRLAGSIIQKVKRKVGRKPSAPAKPRKKPPAPQAS